MNAIIKSNVIIYLLLAAGCTQSGHQHDDNHDHQHAAEQHGDHHHSEELVHLSQQQLKTLGLEMGPLSERNLSSGVEANGQLEVPPQNEATVTAVLGANVTSIEVIEGEEVKKGQLLAYLAHPNLSELQSRYMEVYNRLQFLEQEYQRQQKLYEEEVGSGKAYQQSEAEYRSARASAAGLESQLRQMGVSPERIRSGNFYDRLPLLSPISGFITKVAVKTGQYVAPEKDLFEIVNVQHIHADLMVFEKDVYKVEEGQQVRFRLQTLPGEELQARIYSVGKKFEQNPKAVHVHAEITNSGGKLIPGMYIEGHILTDSSRMQALPQEAITREGGQHYAFVARPGHELGEWEFVPLAVIPGISSQGWVAVSFADPPAEDVYFALNKAYYLMAEMKKGEAEGHAH